MHTSYTRPPRDGDSNVVAAIYEVHDLIQARSAEPVGPLGLTGEVATSDSRYRVSVQVAYGTVVRAYLSEEVAYLSDAPEASARLLSSALIVVACDLARLCAGGALLHKG